MRRETISVVAGGWSLTSLGEEGRSRIPGLRIGVNDAFLKMRCDVGLTMDRMWTEHRWAKVKTLRQPFHASDNAVRNIKIGGRKWLQVFRYNIEALELSDTRGLLHGRNSGHCAFNLAYQMRPRRIILWGFDMERSPSGEAYWYPPYPWSKAGPRGNTSGADYAQWAARFLCPIEQCRAAGIELINASPVSAIIGVRKADPWALLT